MNTTPPNSSAERPSIRSMATVMRKPVEPYWISGVFFRPWTVYLSAVFARLGLSPNFITLISGICMGMAALFLVQDDRIAWALGGAFVLAYFTLDHCDGEVARYNAIVRGVSSGPVGIYWDGVAHGLTPLIMLAVAFRLQMEGSLGPWPMILATLGVTAGCTGPWQRSCEAALAWANRMRGSSAVICVPASFMDSGEDDDDAPPAQGRHTWPSMIKQVILFPGTFVTLPIAAFLDAAVGPISLASTSSADGRGPVLYWVGLWLLQVCSGNILASIRGSRRHARNLKSLAATASPPDENLPSEDPA